MPLYEYRCLACRAQVEVIQKFSDKPLSKCATCGGKLEKLISQAGFILKGSGWYVSDYGRGTAGGKAAAEDPAGSKPADAARPSGGADDAKPGGGADATQPSGGADATKPSGGADDAKKAKPTTAKP